MSNSLFIFGAGFSASAIARDAKSDFKTVYGTTRSPQKLETLEATGIMPVLFGSDNDEEDRLRKAIRESTHLLISVAPGEEGDPVLNVCSDTIRAANDLKWIGYLSTVGVYGNHDGAWVDEETSCKPVSKRSKQRVAAEAAWQELADELNVPLGIFRLSGIYGPGRNALKTVAEGRARRLVKPGQVFNRIHRDDIAVAVCNAMKRSADGIFNVTDHEPAPPQDVVTFACELMGVEPPDPIDFEAADLTPMARSFYGENKRVSNAKSVKELGITYGYPNYREALKRMWEDGSWREQAQ